MAGQNIPFDFNCSAKVTQAALVKMLTWNTYRGVKLEMSKCTFNSERKITRAVGTAPSQDAIDAFQQAIQ